VQLSRLMSHRRTERDHFRRSRLTNRRLDLAGRCFGTRLARDVRQEPVFGDATAERMAASRQSDITSLFDEAGLRSNWDSRNEGVPP
jgi:hypothetical protein